MHNTLVIQSASTPLQYPWIMQCLSSVQQWCELNGYEYQFLGDEFFDGVSEELLEKTKAQRVIATDLARLIVIKEALAKGYEAVVWLDADFLIFDKNNFDLPNELYAIGREVWVQHHKHGKLKAYKKVHNAFLMFRPGNSFLEFYADTAERLLRSNQGSMPPQFIGPKLLTALHSVSVLPVLETAGMLSPLVIRDILLGGGEALDLFKARSSQVISGANLCTSSCNRDEVSSNEMDKLIDILLFKEPFAQ